jgi:hypothetical protein
MQRIWNQSEKQIDKLNNTIHSMDISERITGNALQTVKTLELGCEIELLDNLEQPARSLTFMKRIY